MNKMQTAARRLHALGFKTLPIKPGTKIPATKHGVKDATSDNVTTDAYYAQHPDHGIAISGEGFVIFDFDVKDGLDGRDQLIGWDLPDTLCQTTPSGGYHMIYRTDEEVHPSVNSAIAVDVRGWGSYVVCDPTPGYCFEEDCEPADADETVFKFLEHIRPGQKRGTKRHLEHDDVPEDDEETVTEGGRNDYLYRKGCSQRSHGYSDNKIRAYVHVLNNLNCKPPLPDYEVDKIVASVLEKQPGFSEEVKEQKKRGRPQKFDHAAIGDKLINDNGACFIDGMPAIRHDGKYEVGWNAVSREIIALEKHATKANQREVHHYLTVLAPQMQQSRPTLIAFKNGVLDVDTMQLRKWQPDDVIPNIIPHDWVEDAECPEVDNVLLKMACGEIDVLESLIEVMGVCMYRSSEFTQSAILLGEGSNGKSTYIRMLTALLGKENIASLDMAMIGKQFHTGHLAGKLANLGDDISNEFQRGDLLSIFKKVVDGNRIYTDVKGTEGFEFEPYATLVFSANEFPRLADYTDGMMRRIFPIEFNAKFSKTDADYDPRIAQKVTSKRACQHMACIGVMGLKQVIEHNGFTPNSASSRRVEEIRADNDTVLAWAIDNSWDTDALDGQYIPKLYEHYKAWCDTNGLQAVKRTKFTRGLNKHYGLESAVGWNNGKSEKCFQRKA